MNAVPPVEGPTPTGAGGDFEIWQTTLRERIKQPLPGHAAQRTFEPELGYGRHFGPAPHDARRAAVMLLVCNHGGVAYAPFIVRPHDSSSHAGQISIPGGLIEPGESALDAALRELHEELGVPSADVEPLGPLTPIYIFGTRFDVQPWLAVMPRRPNFVENRAEVAELLEIPLAHLCDPAHHARRRQSIRGVEQMSPYLDWHSHGIWGATAMILGELIALCRDDNPCRNRTEQETVR